MFPTLKTLRIAACLNLVNLSAGWRFNTTSTVANSIGGHLFDSAHEILCLFNNVPLPNYSA